MITWIHTQCNAVGMFEVQTFPSQCWVLSLVCRTSFEHKSRILHPPTTENCIIQRLLFVKRATHRNTRIYHGEFIFRLLSLHTSSCLRFCSSHSSAFDLQQIDLAGTFGKSHTTSRWWRSFVNAGKFFHWCWMGNGPCQRVENIVQLYENCLIKFILYPVDIRCFDRLFHTLYSNCISFIESVNVWM